MVVSPSEQSRKTSPGRASTVKRVDVDLGVGAERARDHRALRVGLRLLGRQAAGAHQVGDERVVLGQLLEPAVAQAVGARVAHVPDRDLSALDDRRGDVVPMPEEPVSLCARS